MNQFADALPTSFAHEREKSVPMTVEKLQGRDHGDGALAQEIGLGCTTAERSLQIQGRDPAREIDLDGQARGRHGRASRSENETTRPESGSRR
jgi:hypothetical protein